MASGMVAAETRERTAAPQAAGSLHGLVSSRPRSQSARAHRGWRPAARVAEKRRPGGLEVHGQRRHHVSPGLGAVLPAGIRRCQCESWCRTEPTKNGSHLLRERPGFSASCVEDPGRAEHRQSLHTQSGELNTWGGERIADQLLAKAGIIRAMHERFQLCQDPQTEFALRESLGQPQPASTWPHNPSGTAGCGNLRLGWTAFLRTPLPGLHGGQFYVSITQRRPVWNRVQRARDIAAPAHLGALIAAKPRFQAMMQNALTAGLLPKTHPAVTETATSTHPGALDDEDRATAKLYVQKAVQAADEAWQQIVGGLQGPSVANLAVADLEHHSSAIQEEDNDDRTSQRPEEPTQYAAAPSAAFTAHGSDRTQAAEEHTLLQRCLAAGYEDRRLVPHARLPRVALSHGRVRGTCPDAARLHHQRAENTWKQSKDKIRRVPTGRLLFWTAVGTWRDLPHRRSYAETLRVRSRCGLRHDTRRPRHHHGVQRPIAIQAR